MNIIQKKDDDDYIDLLALFFVVRRKLPLIILLGVIGGAIAFSYSYYMVVPQYKATATMYVNNKSSNTSTDNYTISQADITASVKLVDTYSAILHSDSLLEQAVETSGIDISVEDLRNHFSTASVNNTEVFSLYVRSTSPEDAAELVNAIAENATTQIGEIIEGSSVKIIDKAKIPTTIDSPSYKKYTMVGTLAGILCGLAIVTLIALADTSIKSEDDLSYWPYPILGVIPDFDTRNSASYYKYSYGKKDVR